MKSLKSPRPIPLFLTAIVAIFSAFAALAVSNGAAHTHAREHGSAVPLLTQKAVAFHDDMRKLWEDHVTWTRLAIISLEGATPDTKATVARLLRNQADIGNAVKPFYGAAVGAKVTSLLRSHILIAADLIAAAKAGDAAKLADAQARWAANADAIAGALHGVNPRHWPLAAMKAEMRKHLQLTTAEAVAHLRGKWAADVAAYDAVHQHILHMSDMLADGLIEQFPNRFE